MTKTISTTVSDEFFQLAQENNIMWSEALRVGISIIAGDRGLAEYQNNTQLYRKMTEYKRLAEDALKKLSSLKDEKM